MSHIVIIVNQLRLGGAERVAALWAKGFVEQGKKVSIITDLSKSVDYDVPLNVNLRHFDFSSKNLKRRFVQSVFELRKIIKSLQPTVIITVLYPLNIFALLANIGLGIPIVNTEHNAFERPNGERLPLIAKLSKFFINRFFSHVTVLTEADKKVVGHKLKKLSVLPNPLTFTPVASIPPKEKWIIASGRLDVWYCKGFDLLIRAWAKLAKEYPDWKLKICGSGSDKSLEYLKTLAIQNHAVNEIEFLGFRKDIQSLYAQSSIFVLSSRYDGFGMVLIEAMSQGCACVACDFKGRQRDIITNENEGIICPIDDEDSIAKALRRLIEDDMYRRKLQDNAIERSKYYELPNIMKYWNEIFDKIGLNM